MAPLSSLVSASPTDQTLLRALTLRIAADVGSIYDPSPTFAYSWDPELPTSPKQHHVGNGHSIDLGPHPADPLARLQSPGEGEHFQGPNVQKQKVFGQEIYVYSGRGGYVYNTHPHVLSTAPRLMCPELAHTRFGDSSSESRLQIQR